MADITKAPEVGRLLITDNSVIESMTPRTLIRYLSEGFIPVNRNMQVVNGVEAYSFDFPSRVSVGPDGDAGEYKFNMSTEHLGSVTFSATDIDSLFDVSDIS